MCFEAFCYKYPNVRTKYLKYGGIIAAIPRKWKYKIQEGLTENLETYVYFIDKVMKTEQSSIFFILYAE